MREWRNWEEEVREREEEEEGVRDEKVRERRNWEMVRELRDIWTDYISDTGQGPCCD